jgi:hypothetical protein
MFSSLSPVSSFVVGILSEPPCCLMSYIVPMYFVSIPSCHDGLLRTPGPSDEDGSCQNPGSGLLRGAHVFFAEFSTLLIKY